MLILEPETQKLLDEAKAHAKTLGGESARSLEESLEFLEGFQNQKEHRTDCRLTPDGAPYSFLWSIYRAGEPFRPGEPRYCIYNGGLFYYAGRESGVGSPQFSVTTSGLSHARWEIHS